MPGTPSGGRKAAATTKKKYGKGFHSKIGKLGGEAGHTGGFYHMSLNDPQRHSALSMAGGTKSRRKPSGWQKFNRRTA